jgi:hypothetical protein
MWTSLQSPDHLPLLQSPVIQIFYRKNPKSNISRLKINKETSLFTARLDGCVGLWKKIASAYCNFNKINGKNI